MNNGKENNQPMSFDPDAVRSTGDEFSFFSEVREDLPGEAEESKAADASEKSNSSGLLFFSDINKELDETTSDSPVEIDAVDSENNDFDLSQTIVVPDEIGADIPDPMPKDTGYVVLTPGAFEAENTFIDDEEKPVTEKKPSFVLRAVKYFIPWKGDQFSDVLRKIILILAIIGLVISSCYIGDFFVKMWQNNSVVSDARKLYDPNDDSVGDDGVYNRFDDLIKQNGDCVGWITVPNTKIDNPVYQTTDNDYYLTHNSLREKSVYGAVFADYRDIISKSGNTKNVTLYGHHMKDGTMLAQLHKYKSISFYQENPVVKFDTIYGTGGNYKVVGCFITNGGDLQDNGYFFDFAAPSFRSDTDFNSWMEQIRRRCLYITPVDVQPSDEILTMSTCTYEIKNANLLCVVVARKVRDGESLSVNTSETYANSKIIYPAVWYEKFGGKKPTYDDGLYTWVSGDYNRENINAPTDTSSHNTVSVASQDTNSLAVASDVQTPSAPTSSQDTSSSSTSTEPSTPSESSQADSSSQAESSESSQEDPPSQPDSSDTSTQQSE